MFPLRISKPSAADPKHVAVQKQKTLHVPLGGPLRGPLRVPKSAPGCRRLPSVHAVSLTVPAHRWGTFGEEVNTPKGNKVVNSIESKRKNTHVIYCHTKALP